MQGGGGPLLTDTIEQSKAINCHSELVSESVPRYERISNIGQTLNQVQGDNMALARIGFTMAEIPHDNRCGCSDNASVTYRKH